MNAHIQIGLVCFIVSNATFNNFQYSDRTRVKKCKLQFTIFQYADRILVKM